MWKKTCLFAMKLFQKEAINAALGVKVKSQCLFKHFLQIWPQAHKQHLLFLLNCEILPLTEFTNLFYVIALIFYMKLFFWNRCLQYILHSLKRGKLDRKYTYPQWWILIITEVMQEIICSNEPVNNKHNYFKLSS